VSQEAIERFNEAMGTIPHELTIEEPPEFFPVHTLVGLPFHQAAMHREQVEADLRKLDEALAVVDRELAARGV
jgi:hypothetical protein